MSIIYMCVATITLFKRKQKEKEKRKRRKKKLDKKDTGDGCIARVRDKIILIARFDLELSQSSMKKKCFMTNWHRSNCTVNSLLFHFFSKKKCSIVGTRYEDGIVFMLCVCMKSEDDGEKMMMMSFRVTH